MHEAITSKTEYFLPNFTVTYSKNYLLPSLKMNTACTAQQALEDDQRNTGRVLT